MDGSTRGEKDARRRARWHERGSARMLLALGAIVALAAFAAGCGGGDSSSSSEDTAAATTEAQAAETTAAETAAAADESAGGEVTYTATLKDGSTFELSPRIQEKLANGEPINYVFSYQSCSIQGFSEQYAAGFERTQEEAKGILPNMTFKAICPSVPQADVPQQIAQIQALADTDQIDCLSIEPATSDGFTQIANELMAEGIPVFTVGVTSNGNEFTNFTQVPNKEGATAAQAVLDYMNANGLDFKVFAVSGGDPSQFWAQGRMQGFMDTIKAAIPDAEFVTTPDSALNVGYDAAGIYDKYKAFLQGAGKDVDVIENVDIGAGYAARAVNDLGKSGETYTVGWNVTPEQIEAIRAGDQIALFDQKWWEQAGFGALACADFLKSGTIRPNTQELLVVNADNLDDAQAELNEILGK